MKTQIYTIQLDYWSDMQKEVFENLMEMTIQAIHISMLNSHKKNKLDYDIQDINWVNWVYEWVMKYRWYNGIWIEDFYDYNRKEIEKHLKKNFTMTLRNIYDDIRDND